MASSESPTKYHFLLYLCPFWRATPQPSCSTCEELAREFEIFNESEHPWNELEIQTPKRNVEGGLRDYKSGKKYHVNDICGITNALQNAIHSGLLTRKADNIKG